MSEIFMPHPICPDCRADLGSDGKCPKCKRQIVQFSSPLSIEQEADALEALEKQATAGPWEIDPSNGRLRSVRHRPPNHVWHKDDMEFIAALRNRALPLIRALKERVRELIDANSAQSELTHTHYIYWQAAQARIESLEAERDIWKGRCGYKVTGTYNRDNGTVGEYLSEWPDPTPEEIAARVEKNRRGSSAKTSP